MAVRDDEYKITWSKRGERANEQPLTVRAHTYQPEGEFFAFYSQDPRWAPPALIVRATDVREILKVADDDKA